MSVDLGTGVGWQVGDFCFVHETKIPGSIRSLKRELVHRDNWYTGQIVAIDWKNKRVQISFMMKRDHAMRPHCEIRPNLVSDEDGNMGAHLLSHFKMQKWIERIFPEGTQRECRLRPTEHFRSEPRYRTIFFEKEPLQEYLGFRVQEPLWDADYWQVFNPCTNRLTCVPILDKHKEPFEVIP